MEERASGPPRRPYMRREAAAEYMRKQWGIELKPATLAKYAVTGEGPKYFKDGKFPLYPPDGIDEWCEARLGALRTSTAVDDS